MERDVQGKPHWQASERKRPPDPTIAVVPQSRQFLLRRALVTMGLPLFLLSALFLALNAFNVAADDIDAAGGHGRLAGKPNFIFIMTDDQDLHLNSLDYQPLLKKHFTDKGTFFKKHFCTVSLCCPSRVSLLTGKAAHNTNVTDVSAPYGGYNKFVAEGHNDKYLPVWLQAAGYNTYYTGKLMNGHTIQTYNKPLAKGWTRSDFLIDPNTYRYLNASTVLDNGKFKFNPGKYSTDLVSDRAVEFLGNAIDAQKPFFLGVTPIGPHSETVLGEAGGTKFLAPIPADRHKDLFSCVKVPRGGNFNPDQPGAVSFFDIPKLNNDQIKYNDNFYRRRLQSLQAVDELVDNIVTKLEAHPEVLANTYLFYTSDNGFHISNHRLPPGKTCSREEDINIPFIARGPGIAAGKVASFPTSHTDLVPTFFELAGIPLHEDFDGIPIPLTQQSLRHNRVKHEHVNVEFWGSGLAEGTAFPNLSNKFSNNTYKTVRVVGDKYDFSYSVWCTNEHELYNIKDDPSQLKNLYGSKGKTSGFSIPELTARLDALLLTLKSCKGKACREPWQTLFPKGDVKNLRQALDRRYDHFFLNQQEKVTFSQCLKGYITSAEGALAPIPYGSKGVDEALEARWEDMV
ncbi:arylsulfatase [Purpureocillium lilacinum]|uniref:Arylsulfatase n=1 Tax=Purpureocillium lilacinum TaxID=33203 RepID=A0A179HTE5_PURLI|nr:arylsulfatase [Purpureocillium lilacinum]OAQ93745.1 arylsulfatase [Purpureocillium lilacinum]